MPFIQLGVDIASGQQAIQQLSDSIKQSAGSLGEFTVKSVQLNEAGRATRAVIEQMDAAGRKVTTTFDVMGNKASIASQKISESAKTAKTALEQLNIAAGAGAGQQARQQFPVPADASIGSIIRYSNAINNLQKAVGAAGLTSAQVNDLFRRMAASPAQFAAAISSLPPNLQNVARELLNVANVAQQVGQAGARGAAAFTISWQGLLRILEVQLFRRAVTAIINALRDGVQAAVSYQIQIQQVANVAAASGGGFDTLRAHIRQASEQFGISSDIIARATQTALTANPGNLVGGLNVATQAMTLARAAGVDLEAAVKLVTTTMQAFGLRSEEAGSTANALFLAAQRSRVPLDEMQNAVGRVSQTARELGLSRDQILSLFVTIAQQGGRPTEAFSLLGQVMGRLITPTRELQQVYQNLGVSSAQVGIQTFGLLGFLERIEQASRATPEAMGEITGSIRTFRSFAAIGGEQAQAFANTLREMGDAPNALRDALERVNQTPAARIQTEFQRLRNIFTEDIGTSFITSVTRISDALGGARTTAVGLIDAVKTLVLGFVGFRVATLAFGTAIATTTISLASLRAGITSFIGTAGGLATVFTLAFTAAQAFFIAIDNAERARLEAMRERIRRASQDTDREIESLRQRGQQAAQQFQQELAQASQPRLQQAAEAVRLATEIRDIFVQRHSEVTQQLRVQNQAFLDSIRSNLSEARQTAQQASQDIISSQRAIQNFRQQAGQRTFQTRVGIEEDPVAAQRLIQQRIARLQVEVTEAFQSGDRSRIESARARVQEIEQLDQELTRRQIEHQRRTAEATGTLVQGVNAYGEAVRIFHADLSDAERREAGIVQFRTRLEEQAISAARRRQQVAEATVAPTQEQLRIFELMFRQLEQFRIFNQEGALLPQFQAEEIQSLQQGRGPGAGALAGMAELARLQARVTEQARAFGINIENLTPIFNLQRDNLQQQVGAQQRLTRETSNQANEAERLAAAQRQITDAVNRQTERQTTLTSQIGEISRVLASLPQLPDTIGSTLRGRVTEQTRLNFEDLARAINLVRDAQTNLVSSQTPENARQLAISVQFLSGAVERLAADRGQLAALPIGVQQTIDRLVGAGQITILERTVQQVPETVASLTNARTATDLLRQSIVNVAGAGGAMTANFNTFASAVTSSQGIILNTFNQAEGAAARTASSIRQMTTDLQTLQRQAAQVAGGVPAQGFATGGYVYGPRGTDVIPAWLTRGEFVMPASQTRKFFTQLMSMRAGVQPRYMATGGPVTVGDIHVHMSSSGRDDRDIREIGRGLRREIKRGTIRLN